MSWASRKKTTYISVIVVFFVVIIGAPVAYKILTIPASCHDGKQDQGESAPDEGGPCLKLDPRTLQPEAILWARSFAVRPGQYSAVAYVENPNPDAGVPLAHYHLALYDDQGVLITEQDGTTFIMPGGITPILVTGISTGNRVVVHTSFEFTDPVLPWERMSDPASSVTLNNEQTANTTVMPSLTARAQNTSYNPLDTVSFVGVVFDPNGNAFAASATQVSEIDAGANAPVAFTWPYPFPAQVGRIDIIPVMPPVPDPTAQL